MPIEREVMLAALREEEYDLLVIGGGATGCGVALDAASRGLKVAQLERYDFAEGTSGRSTKLIHGGVRYLEKALRNFDYAQMKLVLEGLSERAKLLKIAPHVVHTVPLITPLYRWLQIPYIWLGLKIYDLLAGKKGISKSSFLSVARLRRTFPELDARGLKAGVLYYDGQFNDIRMVVALVQTAAQHGATCVNYTEAVGFDKKEGSIVSTRVRDNITGEIFAVRSKCVINAAGPFADNICHLDEPANEPVLSASTGVHIVIDKRFMPRNTGMLIPKTEDGRILFAIPWEHHLLIGSTDTPAEIVDHPPVSEGEIDYILRHMDCYLEPSPTRNDVKSAWSGIRPLISAAGHESTQSLVRGYKIDISPSGLISVFGGKWTSYRLMAEKAVDTAIKRFSLPSEGPSETDMLTLAGSENYHKDAIKSLVGEGLGLDIAEHLHGAYGDKASTLLRLSRRGLGKRLAEGHPYIEAEVVYGVREELVIRAVDFLCRRIPLALLDIEAAKSVAPRVIELMASESSWSEERIASEEELVRERLFGAL
ncbi:MAG: glycerol-3-phosphate dehydrogenase [Deltaproteobacteria bacterium]|nr:MAG: glycerol-3-phosphate dehydrogenase [Deltaproteobacteria bacterium]